MDVRRLPNRAARAVFLDRHGLAQPPSGPGKGADLLEVITRLGFVQVDSVNTLERAHHMILFSRRPAYRPAHLGPLIERDRLMFEHWTHDAAIIPSAFLPQWRLKFARDRERITERWKTWRREGYEHKFDEVLDRIARHGPVCSRDVGNGEEKGSTGWWDWHPSKTALEFLWRSGDLAICHREGFRKFYDLSGRVYGTAADGVPDVAETVDWCCRAALDRLGFATPGEIAAFWDIVTPAEARYWCARAQAAGEIEPVNVEDATGGLRRSFALVGPLDAPTPTSRLRVMSPFDPALRDRARAERLFGFSYRIEIFVPEAKRTYGYYVFPLLEGDRLVGRVDMKADRAAGLLRIAALWPERGVDWGKGRMARFEAELDRLCRFAGLDGARFADGWLREPR